MSAEADAKSPLLLKLGGLKPATPPKAAIGSALELFAKAVNAAFAIPTTKKGKLFAFLFVVGVTRIELAAS